MNRKEWLLRSVDREGLGLEIGPSYVPIAPKKEGFRVHILDTMDQAGLRAKYRDHAVDLEAIEPVDYVWRGENYRDLTGNSYSWIIASHVIEHTPDLIGFLNGCADVLSPDGVLSLAIPDKRFCFDRWRPISSLSSVVDSHFSGRRKHSTGSIVEQMMNTVTRGGQIAWGPEQKGPYKFICTQDQILGHLNASKAGLLDMDMHAWTFTPSSFRLMIKDLNTLGLVPLREASFHGSEGHEFFATLSRSGTGSDLTRMELLVETERELCAASDK